MLTKTEYDQLSAALTVMWGINLGGDWHIPLAAVQELVATYVDRSPLPALSGTATVDMKLPKSR